jgi:hypothetical protein
MNDNIRLLNTDPDEMIAQVEQMRRWFVEIRRLSEEVATTRFAFYQAHLAAGFDETQALDLCRTLEL